MVGPLVAGVSQGRVAVAFADVRCPMAGCSRRWHRAEVSPHGILIEAKCDSARCHGAIRTVLWEDGRAILMEIDARPDAQSAEPSPRHSSSADRR